VENVSLDGVGDDDDDDDDGDQGDDDDHGQVIQVGNVYYDAGSDVINVQATLLTQY